MLLSRYSHHSIVSLSWVGHSATNFNFSVTLLSHFGTLLDAVQDIAWHGAFLLSVTSCHSMCRVARCNFSRPIAPFVALFCAMSRRVTFNIFLNRNSATKQTHFFPATFIPRFLFGCISHTTIASTDKSSNSEYTFLYIFWEFYTALWVYPKRISSETWIYFVSSFFKREIMRKTRIGIFRNFI